MGEGHNNTQGDVSLILGWGKDLHKIVGRLTISNEDKVLIINLEEQYVQELLEIYPYQEGEGVEDLSIRLNKNFVSALAIEFYLRNKFKIGNSTQLNQREGKGGDVDPAQTATRGGIDLTPKQMDKAIQSKDAGKIQFHLDVAQMAQWEKAPGVSFEIMEMRSILDIPHWLDIPLN